MASYDKAFESYKKALTTAASVAASMMLVRSVVNDVVPPELRDLLFSGFGYLATRMNTDIQQRLRVSSMDENDKMMVSMDEGDEMLDVYEGTEFKWCLVCKENSNDSLNGSQNESQFFELTFNKKHKDKALKSYLPFILATAKAIKAQERTLMIYMTEYDDWSPIDLHHPSTFDTLAMDHKLLYGPPGTGKSSLIAAMANHLRFDIYDLELTAVTSNSDLRRLLVGLGNRSILVIEDIDCTIEFQCTNPVSSRSHHFFTCPNKNFGFSEQVTLSGLLNFVDGLWSTSGEERIIVFTTNYKERLDPALLRPGRMDMHIHMGYCTPESFRILANNYHSVEYHDTYPEIEKLIKEVMVTPAEVAEVLMRNDDADVVLHDLVDFLKSKMKDANEIKAEHKEANNQLDEKKDDKDNEKK